MSATSWFPNTMTTKRNWRSFAFGRVRLRSPFSDTQAVCSHHRGKASGYNGFTTEHIAYAGFPMIESLTLLSNMVRISEYVPVCRCLYLKVNTPAPWIQTTIGALHLCRFLTRFWRLLSDIEWSRGGKRTMLSQNSSVRVRRVSRVSTQLCYYRRRLPRHWRLIENGYWLTLTW